MQKELEIDTFKSVGVTQLIPDEWESFIWTGLSDGAPFSWGDNNHTLVDAMSFKIHLDNVLDLYGEEEECIEKHRQSVFDTLIHLQTRNIYIDLEQ